MGKLLVVLSGDVLVDKKVKNVVNFLKFAARTHRLYVCPGGGTQINAAFQVAGLEVREHGPLGRHMNGHERSVQERVLQQHVTELARTLAREGVRAFIMFPEISAEASEYRCDREKLNIADRSVIKASQNGDWLPFALYHAFDRIVRITLADRVERKRELYRMFDDRKKIQVVGY